MGQFLKSSPCQRSWPSYFSFPFLIIFPHASRPTQLAQRTSACPACLLSNPRPTMILAHSGPTAFPARTHVAHLTAQWPALAHSDSFVLATPTEAEPSAHAAACRAPLPSDVASTSTLLACTRAWRGLHRPVHTPLPPYPFEGDFEPKQNGKKRESNSCQIRKELLKNLRLGLRSYSGRCSTHAGLLGL
jgi:hypothetical protein